MRPKSSIRRWKEGTVDASESHLALTAAPHEGAAWDDYFLVARIAPPVGDTVDVEFVVDRTDPRFQEAVARVIKQIDFYLIEKGEPDAWGYACYHCGTLANAYSGIHWGHFEPRTNSTPES